MMRVARLLAVMVLIGVAAPSQVQAVAQPTVSEHRTPSGIAFQHLAMADEIQHALAFGWPDGYALTVAGKEGLAVLAPRLMLEGTRAMDESTRIELLKDLQASLGFGGGASFAVGSLIAVKGKFPDAAGVLSDMLADPLLPANKLARLKRTYAESSRQAQENTQTLASRLFTRVVLGEVPLMRLSVSDPGSYMALEVTDVDAWRRHVLVRDRLVVVSAGPLPASEVAAHIDRIFAGLPVSTDAAAASPLQLHSSGKLIVLERPVVQTAIVAGGAAAWIEGTSMLPGTLAVRVLAGGFEARLMKAVREKLGAAYGIRASVVRYRPHVYGALISTAVDNTKAAAALAAIRAEYQQFHAEGVTTSEIEPVKTKLIAETREQVRRAPGAAARIRDDMLNGYPADYYATLEARVRALSAADISDDIRVRFPKPPLTIVMVAPSAQGLGADCVIKAPEEISRCE